LAPFLHGKPLDVNVACTFGRFAMVNNLDGGLIIFIDDSRLGKGETEFSKDGTKITTDFSALDGGKEFRFSGTSGDDWLSLHTISNSSTRHDKSISGSGALGTEIVGMRGIDDGERGHEFRGFGVFGQVVRINASGDRGQGKRRKGRVWNRAPIDEAPVECPTKIFGDAF
jgi:hypothetical protein